MCETESRKDLPLASTVSGCSCCSTGAAGESVTVAGGAEYALEGLTCGHCVQTVEKAVAAVDGVEATSIELVPGGRSRLSISGFAAETAVREAVTSTGYSLISS